MDASDIATLVLRILQGEFELTAEEKGELCSAAVRALDHSKSALVEPLASLADGLLQAVTDFAYDDFGIADARLRLEVAVRSYCLAAMALRADAARSDA